MLGQSLDTKHGLDVSFLFLSLSFQLWMEGAVRPRPAVWPCLPPSCPVRCHPIPRAVAPRSSTAGQWQPPSPSRGLDSRLWQTQISWLPEHPSFQVRVNAVCPWGLHRSQQGAEGPWGGCKSQQVALRNCQNFSLLFLFFSSLLIIGFT